MYSNEYCKKQLDLARRKSKSFLFIKKSLHDRKEALSFYLQAVQCALKTKNYLLACSALDETLQVAMNLLLDGMNWYELSLYFAKPLELVAHDAKNLKNFMNQHAQDAKVTSRATSLSRTLNQLEEKVFEKIPSSTLQRIYKHVIYIDLALGSNSQAALEKRVTNFADIFLSELERDLKLLASSDDKPMNPTKLKTHLKEIQDSLHVMFASLNDMQRHEMLQKTRKLVYPLFLHALRNRDARLLEAFLQFFEDSSILTHFLAVSEYKLWEESLIQLAKTARDESALQYLMPTIEKIITENGMGLGHVVEKTILEILHEQQPAMLTLTMLYKLFAKKDPDLARSITPQLLEITTKRLAQEGWIQSTHEEGIMKVGIRDFQTEVKLVIDSIRHFDEFTLTQLARTLNWQVELPQLEQVLDYLEQHHVVRKKTSLDGEIYYPIH